MNFGISGTGGRSETSGRVEKAGRIEKGGSASQSQRMHGAGYVGAIVGQEGVFFCFCGLSFVVRNYFVSLSLETNNKCEQEV